MSAPRRPRRAVSGILLLDKPRGWTSSAATLQIRHWYRADKAGHTGSLDPLATGMLPICLGQATKLSGQLLDADKRYRATVALGAATDTGDADGEVLARQTPQQHSAEAIRAVFQRFIGPQMQVPPMYSALKQEGQRLYALAREGQTVTREPRPIVIHDLVLLDAGPERWELEVHCSKGTYIRVLAEDLAAALGERAHLQALRRVAVAPFAGPMIDLAVVEASASQGLAALDALLQPLSTALMGWPKLQVSAAQARTLRRGQPLRLQTALPPPGPCAVVAEEDEGLAYCLAERCPNGEVWPRRWLADDTMMPA
jgi:tRNA pseudouridine55 synthase